MPLPPVTPLPCVPAFVRGIINVRGRIVSLIDLRRAIGLPVTETSPAAKVIILQSAAIELGLLADEIMGLADIPLSSLRQSLPGLTDVSSGFLKGATAEGLVLLDAARLLADESLVINETVGGAR
jgi:purine-binding chemotaxis protein CheW